MSQSAAGNPGAWRVGDADRQAAVEALGEHYATGRLDHAEFEDRSQRALSAKFDHDLTGLFADLPQPHGDVVAAPPSPMPQMPWSPPRPGVRRQPPAGRRFPVGPLIFAGFVLAIVMHSFWLFWLVPMFLWLVVRPMRHQHWGGHPRRWVR